MPIIVRKYNGKDFEEIENRPSIGFLKTALLCYKTGGDFGCIKMAC